ncbi:MAG: hypothetical protein KA712_13610 [Myxococcales bacterium]|nr:hypothetical protein [Myxococcales bacterium]
MLWTLALGFILLWMLAVLTSVTTHGFIHLLLAAAVVTAIIRVLVGRAPAP